MKEKLLKIIAEVCEAAAVKDDCDLDLFEEGFLDSLGLTELLIAIEEEFGVTISPTAYEKEQLSSVNKIISVLKEKGVTL